MFGMENKKKANYGIDGLIIILVLLSSGIAGFIIASILLVFPLIETLVISIIAINYFLWGGLAYTILGLHFLYSTKRGKIKECEKLISLIPWRGDERVLDVGCGRGILLISAAKRLTTGKAIGVDIWRQIDQHGNRMEETITNARVEGVLDKVEVKDGDARDLPFDNESFDVIVSSLVIHNIHDKKEREKAINEVLRVIKLGGYFAILDIRRIDEYAQILRSIGVSEVKKIKGSFLFLHRVNTLFGKK
jgi:arsenite methyltransferase